MLSKDLFITTLFLSGKNKKAKHPHFHWNEWFSDRMSANEFALLLQSTPSGFILIAITLGHK